MNLLQMLLGTMTSTSSVNSLSQQTGSSKKSITKLLMLALPLLIKYLTKNASSQSGAQSLLGALLQHKSTRSMDAQIGEADQQDGERIVRHILGNDSDEVMRSLAKESDMDVSQVESILASIAPALMSGLSAAATQGNAKKDDRAGFDLTDLMGMFGGSAQSSSDGLGMIESLLGGGASSSQGSGSLLDAFFGSGGGSQSMASASGSLLSSLFGMGQSAQAQPQTQTASPKPSSTPIASSQSSNHTKPQSGSSLVGALLGGAGNNAVPTAQSTSAPKPAASAANQKPPTIQLVNKPGAASGTSASSQAAQSGSASSGSLLSSLFGGGSTQAQASQSSYDGSDLLGILSSLLG